MYKHYKIKVYDLNEKEYNIYVNGLLTGFFWGMCIMTACWIGIFFFEEANAQVNMSATVEKSDYYKCLDSCEELINGKF